MLVSITLTSVFAGEHAIRLIERLAPSQAFHYYPFAARVADVSDIYAPRAYLVQSQAKVLPHAS
jgi:hypothetical protein